MKKKRTRHKREVFSSTSSFFFAFFLCGQSQTRKEAIFDSTINAASVPLEIMYEASNLLNDIINLAKFGNLNALTDLLGSAELAYSSSKIASLNVRINLDSINSGDQKEDLNGQMLELTLLTKERYQLINKIIMERLQWK